MWLTNLRLILPDRIVERGALRLQDGLIAEIAEGGALPAGLDLDGLTAVPGLIDLHGDMLERDIEPRPRAFFPVDLALYELDKRMAAAGITTAYTAVAFAWMKGDLRRQDVATRIIETVNALRHTLLIDLRVHARFEVNNPTTVPVLDDLLRRGLVDLVSVMDHTPGQGQYADATRNIQFLKEWYGFTDVELAPIAERVRAHADRIEEKRQRDWEVVRGIAAVAREHGAILAAHDDDTADKVAAQAAMGMTISEFPVNLAAAQAARAHRMHIIMGAPNAYRGESNTGNLSALDALRAGLVDILASDYFPAAMLHSAYKIARDGLLPLHESLKLVSANPAAAVGLTDRGQIAVGQRADLALVDESHTQPRVRGTLRAGHFIYQDAHIVRLAAQAHLPARDRAELFVED
jgi:alpha-D-ribose 1-methylphosphonate 5-triphosphate diphosphatase